MAIVRFQRKQDNLGKHLIFGISDRNGAVALSDLTDPVLKIRLQGTARSTATELAGTLSTYADPTYNCEYRWHASDPNEPGVYLLELEATDSNGDTVVFPDPDRFELEILG